MSFRKPMNIEVRVRAISKEIKVTPRKKRICQRKEIIRKTMVTVKANAKSL